MGISYLIGSIIGALAIALLFYSVFKYLLFKASLSKPTCKILAMILCAVLFFVIWSLKMQPSNSIIYIGATIFWGVIDYFCIKDK